MEKITTEETITTETVASEVQQEQKNTNSEVAVKSEFEKAIDGMKASKDLRKGQIVSAVITSAKDEGLTLSIKGAKRDDLSLPKEEIIGEYDKANYKDKVGQKIRVMVIAKNPIVFSEKAMESVLK